MNRLARALMGLCLLGAVAAALGPAASPAAENEQVTICHRTHSEPNPWVAITVSEDAVPAHLEHGDFVVSSGTPCPPLDDNDPGWD